MASRGEDFTLGIEEEYFLVDAATRALGRGSEAVIDRARQSVSEQADHELQLSQVESVTPVCRTLAEVRGHLRHVRRELAAAADLAEEARAAGLNVSNITQDPPPAPGFAPYLGLGGPNQQAAPTGVPHDRVIEALDAAREEMGTRVDG